MDIQKLQSVLLARGIRISDDDPVFTLVAFNEVLLEEMTKKHQETFNEVDERVADKLTAIVDKTVSQIAGKEVDARATTAITQKVMWMVGGELVGMAMFALGIGYGAIHSTWTNPTWIDRNGLLAVLSSALLKAPVGGVGFIAIALTMTFLQKGLTDLMAGNEDDKPVLKFISYLVAAILSAIGLWLCFLVMFK